ncbi:MAG: hypothetical protein KDJ41_04650 [Hyphomicrobiaceae bacterium]|nr:hypothetical protein [Hyphomicrobiaceae bacterium]
MRLPDDIAIDSSEEIEPKSLSLEFEGRKRAKPQPNEMAEQQISPWLRWFASQKPAPRRVEPGIGRAQLYRSEVTAVALVNRQMLRTSSHSIGVLFVDDAPVVLQDEAAGAVEIPPGRYYVGSDMRLAREQTSQTSQASRRSKGKGKGRRGRRRR